MSALEACPPGGVSAWRHVRLEACPPGGLSAGEMTANRFGRLRPVTDDYGESLTCMDGVDLAMKLFALVGKD